jgi:hypothetical protein
MQVMPHELAQDSDTKHAQREIKNMSIYTNTQNIAAIPTFYNGTLFRSRLEARWAVFFHSMGIEYQYEPQHFQKDYVNRVIRYLPDFYLPELGCWAEVKGTQNNLNADWDSKMRDVLDYHPTPIYETLGTKKGFIILGPIPVYNRYMMGTTPTAFFTFIQHHEGLFANKCCFFRNWATGEINLFVLNKDGDSMNYYDCPILEYTWMHTKYDFDGIHGSALFKENFETAQGWDFNKGNNQ